MSDCDGTDRHPLGWTARTRAGALGTAFALLLLASRVSELGGFKALAWGLLLGVALTTGMSTSVIGNQVRVNRFGWRRQIPLADVSRVDLYMYRSAVSLRLWDAGGERLPSIPISGLAYRISPAAAAHLLRYIDRPDVSWGPGSWNTMHDKASGALPTPPPNAPAEEPLPRGRLVAGKPFGGWAKTGLYFSGVMSVVMVVVLLVLVPVTWRGYRESQRIQHGPYASATLLSENITTTSGRSGTHHTTHFHVIFATEAGQDVTATVDAHGRYRQLPPGTRFGIRYDPRSPTHAELPGRPMNDLATALIVTVIAGVTAVTLGSIGTVFVRSRRRRRATELTAGLI